MQRGLRLSAKAKQNLKAAKAVSIIISAEAVTLCLRTDITDLQQSVAETIKLSNIATLSVISHWTLTPPDCGVFSLTFL